MVDINPTMGINSGFSPNNGIINMFTTQPAVVAAESNRVKYGSRVFDITYIDNSNEEDVYKRWFLVERR